MVFGTAYAWLYLGSALVAFVAVVLASTFRRSAGLGAPVPAATTAR